MPSFLKVEAVVVYKRTIKENDLRVILLTRKEGKLLVFAKGAKNIKSSRVGVLEMGNIIKAGIYEKNGYMWLSEAKALDVFLKDKKSLVQLNLLFYLLETINNLIADNQQTDGIYEVVKNAIKAIRENKFISYIKCEMELLQKLGFGVPEEAKVSFDQKDYKTCQRYLRNYLESIVEKPIRSGGLF